MERTRGTRELIRSRRRKRRRLFVPERKGLTRGPERRARVKREPGEVWRENQTRRNRGASRKRREGGGREREEEEDGVEDGSRNGDCGLAGANGPRLWGCSFDSHVAVVS